MQGTLQAHCVYSPVDNLVVIPAKGGGEQTRRNVSNDMNFVPFLLSLEQLLNQPGQLTSGVSVVHQQPAVCDSITTIKQINRTYMNKYYRC